MPDSKAKPGAAQDEFGACWVINQQTGQQECIFVTAAECANQGGTFNGGPCPAFDALAAPKKK